MDIEIWLTEWSQLNLVDILDFFSPRIDSLLIEAILGLFESLGIFDSVYKESIDFFDSIESLYIRKQKKPKRKKKFKSSFFFAISK